MNHPSNAHHPPPHASTSAAAAGPPPCGCEPGAIRRGARCSSEDHGIAPHQVVPVNGAPASSSVTAGNEGDQRLQSMLSACATLNPFVLPPEPERESFTSMADWLPTLCLAWTIRVFFALSYDGVIAAAPLDKRGRERKRKLNEAPWLSGFSATDAKAHALRDCKDLVDALGPMGVFQTVPWMSSAAMTKTITGLPIFRQIGFPATLLRHAIRLCNGTRVQSFFVQFARTIHAGRVGLEAVPLTTAAGNPIEERTLCFWLNYFFKNHTALALSPHELNLMVEALRQDGIFVPMPVECKTALRPLIAQIVQLNRTIEQQQNQHQFPMMFAGQQPQVEQPAAAAAAASSVAASSSVISHQAVLAAAGAASAAGSSSASSSSVLYSQGSSIDRYVFAGSMRPFEPSSPSMSSVDSTRSPGSSASSLAPTSAASSESRSSTPSRWSSTMSDDESESQDASQGQPRSIFGDDADVDLGFGPVEGNFDEFDETAQNDEDQFAMPNKRQRLPAFDRSDLDVQHLIMAHHASSLPVFDLAAGSAFAAGPFGSPDAPAFNDSYLPPLAQSAPAMASGFDAPNAPVFDPDSFLNQDYYLSGASSPVDSSSSSPRDF